LMVYRCLLAASDLEAEGISASVIEIHTLKPLDRDLILNEAAQVHGLVTVEEHSVIGGLGSAVAEVISGDSSHVQLARIGIADCYAETGPHESLLDRYGMSVKDIVAGAHRVLDSSKKTTRPTRIC